MWLFETMNRRSIGLMGLASMVAATLSACGFRLRQPYDYAFKTIAVLPSPGAGVALELRRSFGQGVQALASGSDPSKAEVVLQVLEERRVKVVVGTTAAGQVREFQLRIHLKFQLRTAQGKDLIPVTEISQQRDSSFTESAVLAKDTEEAMLYRDMQTDLVQQLLRRLAAVKSL